MAIEPAVLTSKSDQDYRGISSDTMITKNYIVEGAQRAFDSNVVGFDQLMLDRVAKITAQEVSVYNWRKEINMQGRVIGAKADIVLCECLLDPEERIFETRSFPKLLFENIPNLAHRPFVYISIKMKPGTTKIDIIDGSKRVDKKLFEENTKWDELLKDSISKPLTKPIG